jgi:multiple antibiotic resistance protein
LNDTLAYFGLNFFNFTKNGLLIGLPALFSIVSPVGGALIFYGLTEGSTTKERYALGWRVAFYSAITMLASLLLGAAILSFFGIGVSALRIAGGLLVATAGWQSLNSSQTYEQRALSQSSETSQKSDHAFFPLTMPLTTGPGTISVCIALSASKGETLQEILPYLLGLSLAALIVAFMVGVFYSSAQRIVSTLGEQKNAIFIRILAFILLCIGVQILLTGLADFYNTLNHLAPK